VNRLIELCDLLGQRADQVPGENFRKAGNVEDELLGIERRELAAKFRQRVDDLRRGAPHSGIEQSEDPGGTAADDGEIANVVEHGLKNSEFRHGGALLHSNAR